MSPWSYPEDIVSQVIETVNKDEISENERVIDLSWGAPAYEEDREYIAKIKQELGIKVSGDMQIPMGFAPVPCDQHLLCILKNIYVMNFWNDIIFMGKGELCDSISNEIIVLHKY